MPARENDGVFMRKVVLSGLASAVSLVGLAAGAVAASIVSVAPPQETPSILSVGEAAPAPIEARPVETAGAQDGGTEILAIGNSVVAIGAEAIPPSREEVAAIGETADPEAPALPGWLADDGAPALRGGLDGESAPRD